MRLTLSRSQSVSLILSAIVASGVTIAAEKDGGTPGAAAPGSSGSVSASEMLELKRLLMDQQRQIEELRRELRAQKPAAAEEEGGPTGNVATAGGVLTKQRSIGETATTAPMVPPNPLTISGVSTSATPESVTVTWTTNEPATSRLDWGTAPGALSRNVADPNLLTLHSLTMTGLTPGTTYYVEITSVSAAGETVHQKLGETAKAPAPTVAAPTCPPLCAPVKSDQIEWPLQLRIGNSYITPVGFMDMTLAYRDTAAGSNIGTNFGSIPYRIHSNVPGNLSETVLSPQNSRIGARFDSIFKGTKVLGYWESDFLGFVPTNVEVNTHSYSLRLRLFFVDLKKSKFEFLAGQSWSLLTPGRKGISPLPADLFYSQATDVNYITGLPWGRIPQFRFVYHANNNLHFAVSAEDPQQYIGGSGGGGVVVLPTGLATAYGGQLNNGTTNQSVPNYFPDIIAKMAIDGGPVHFELGGLFSEYKVYNPTSVTKFTKSAGGVQANVNVAVTKGFRLIANTYWSDGAGRYLFGFAPDLVIKGNGDIGLLKSGGTADGFEFTHKNTLFYAYYGASYVGKYSVIDPANNKFVGYGYPGSANSQNRSVQELTGGFNQTIWKNPAYGAVNLMGQYAYFTRNPWVVLTGASKETHMNEVFINVRYTLPGAAPSLK